MLARLFAVLTTLASVSEENLFEGVSLEQAMVKAQATGKFVLIDVFTTWCLPCKRLDQTTWKAPNVQEWLKANTIPIKVDAEETDWVADQFNVVSYPTVILVRSDGSELGRIVGYRDPGAFLQEASEILAGVDAATRARSRGTRALAEAKARSVRDSWNPLERQNYAEALADSGQFVDALKEYLWCFDNGVEHYPPYYGIRYGTLALEITEFGKDYPPAIQALMERRDVAEAMLVSNYFFPDCISDIAVDVVRLNQSLSTPERVLVIFDVMKSRDIGELQTLIAERVPELFVATARYCDLLEAVSNVEGQVNREIQRAQSFAKQSLSLSDGGETQEALDRALALTAAATIRKATVWYESLLGANECERAAEVANQLIAADRSGHMYIALIERAVHCGYIEEAHALVERGRLSLSKIEQKRVERAASRISQEVQDGDDSE